MKEDTLRLFPRRRLKRGLRGIPPETLREAIQALAASQATPEAPGAPDGQDGALGSRDSTLGQSGLAESQDQPENAATRTAALKFFAQVNYGDADYYRLIEDKVEWNGNEITNKESLAQVLHGYAVTQNPPPPAGYAAEMGEQSPKSDWDTLYQAVTGRRHPNPNPA